MLDSEEELEADVHALLSWEAELPVRALPEHSVSLITLHWKNQDKWEPVKWSNMGKTPSNAGEC